MHPHTCAAAKEHARTSPVGDSEGSLYNFMYFLKRLR